jgi:PEP-CTERM motif-containing protein
VDPGETPEPATTAFIGAGLIALAIWHRQSGRRERHHLVI